jgi:hypothetical protein
LYLYGKDRKRDKKEANLKKTPAVNLFIMGKEEKAEDKTIR